ncbi:hypothetical protein SAMN04489712_10133 [Thermomonospora echinospora]|uniref:Uncharacterized protein n=1 Tax=Thermomonospora echinospora TaxID=1992 RepID=A0A1H5S112_9ACTN|nr:hypothetical protein [Thermomonospora echinospora]SEF44180.1 hypothetical protein SAMN04489712_10133 [Thermomonospora echinospora]
MKFELVEPPEPGPSGAPPEDGQPVKVHALDEGTDDPIAGLVAITHRLTVEVAAESIRVRAATAELAAAVHAGPYALRTFEGVRPPAGFRAGRFGPAARAGEDRRGPGRSADKDGRGV